MDSRTKQERKRTFQNETKDEKEGRLKLAKIQCSDGQIVKRKIAILNIDSILN
jgi:hypothetical protein